MQTFLGLQRSIDTFTPGYFKRFLKNTIFAGWHTFMTVFEQKIKQQSAIYFDFCRCTHTELILLYHLSFSSDHIKLLKYNAKESPYLPSTRTNKSTCKRGSSLGVCVWAVNCVSVFLSVLHVSRRKEGLQCVGPMNQLLTAYQRLTQRKQKKTSGKNQETFQKYTHFTFRFQVIAAIDSFTCKSMILTNPLKYKVIFQCAKRQHLGWFFQSTIANI